jgi:hypothetical protein
MADMNDDPARQRFMVLQCIRISGVAFAVVGAAIMAGKIHSPPQIGLIPVVFGVFDVLVLPALLTRNWKSRD